MAGRTKARNGVLFFAVIGVLGELLTGSVHVLAGFDETTLRIGDVEAVDLFFEDPPPAAATALSAFTAAYPRRDCG
jgi:hypothetical protein